MLGGYPDGRFNNMNQSEIDAIRALLAAKPRPRGWKERRQRLDEIGSNWPVADDVGLAPVDLGGLRGEWSIVRGSDLHRVLLYFNGGGYCSGFILSHLHLVTEAGRASGVHTLAVAYRLAPENPFPAARDDAPPHGASCERWASQLDRSQSAATVLTAVSPWH
jgi:monoterpene epsilon-lactone hydrolase